MLVAVEALNEAEEHNMQQVALEDEDDAAFRGPSASVEMEDLYFEHHQLPLQVTNNVVVEK